MPSEREKADRKLALHDMPLEVKAMILRGVLGANIIHDKTEPTWMTSIYSKEKGLETSEDTSLIGSVIPVIGNAGGVRYGGSPEIGFGELDIGMLLVNKSISAEATRILYSTNTFAFWMFSGQRGRPGLRDFISHRTKLQLANLKSLQFIAVSNGKMKDYRREIMKTFQPIPFGDLKSLKCIYLHVHVYSKPNSKRKSTRSYANALREARKSLRSLLDGLDWLIRDKGVALSEIPTTIKMHPLCEPGNSTPNLKYLDGVVLVLKEKMGMIGGEIIGLGKILAKKMKEGTLEPPKKRVWEMTLGETLTRALKMELEGEESEGMGELEGADS